MGPWSDFLWRAVSAFNGAPDTPAWTKLSDDGERATFFVGTADIELYRSEAGNYRENLLVEQPLLWVALRSTAGDHPMCWRAPRLIRPKANPGRRWGPIWSIPSPCRSPLKRWSLTLS